ncbi:MAG: ATP-binding protein [candidate division Zixibacteria bacterium]|nr:ATP-binding protein [candidate division Zixibacteria bacterium]
MEISKIKDALEAVIIEANDTLEGTVEHIYASDLMSDVLAFGKPNSILLTGLATRQAVISAHMAEFKGVVFIRGKRPKDGSDHFARDHHMVLLSTQLDMYDACLRVEAVKRGEPQNHEPDATGTVNEELLLCRELIIQGSDFASAGMASTEIKSVLKTIGLDPKLVRRVAISTYEGEMNVVMHAIRARVVLSVTPRIIEVVIADEGKGIPDVNLAMQEGYTTATEEMRAMGFGSGMGLPNIRRNADELLINSEVGKGTTLVMRFTI